jgi:4-amino-4-deoxy-L-arabinose transferase-like glycosyltransferase
LPRGARPNWLGLFRWIAIGWVVVFWRLGYLSLLDPDEAHYAQLTRELVQQGGWLVPLLDGKPFIDKPVLFHWLQGTSFLLLGETEFAARLPTAIATLALFAVTRWVGAVLFGGTVGEWGAIMFATIPATFALSSMAIFDMVFSAFLFGAVGCLLVACTQQRPRLEWCGYGLLTLAVLTKGPVALVLVGLFVITARLVPGDAGAHVKRLRWKTGLLAATIAASPWFLWMSWRLGMEFIRGYTFAGNLWYFTQPAQFSGRAIHHTFYVRTFAGAFFPWSLIVAGRGVDVLRALRTGRSLNTGETLLWVWVLVVIGFFSIARFKLDHYIFPAAPACCLLAANAWRLAADDADGWLRGTRFSVLAIAVAMILAGSFGSVDRDSPSPGARRRRDRADGAGRATAMGRAVQRRGRRGHAADGLCPRRRGWFPGIPTCAFHGARGDPRQAIDGCLGASRAVPRGSVAREPAVLHWAARPSA